jgi:plastocyanin
MRRLTLLVPIALVSLLAGCGSSSSSSSSSAPATSSSSSSAAAPSGGTGGKLTLSETEFKIAPASPAVAKTGKIMITVKNSGAITHALAVQTPTGLVKTGPIAAGATATLTVNAAKAGKYTFYCPIGNHRMLGMQGTLVVGSGASASSSSGSATPASTSSSSGGGGGSYGY